MNHAHLESKKASIINIKQNIQENSKGPLNTYANLQSKFQCWFRKTNTLVSYFNSVIVKYRTEV